MTPDQAFAIDDAVRDDALGPLYRSCSGPASASAKGSGADGPTSTLTVGGSGSGRRTASTPARASTAENEQSRRDVPLIDGEGRIDEPKTKSSPGATSR